MLLKNLAEGQDDGNTSDEILLQVTGHLAMSAQSAWRKIRLSEPVERALILFPLV